jgi:hypothetical protein
MRLDLDITHLAVPGTGAKPILHATGPLAPDRDDFAAAIGRAHSWAEVLDCVGLGRSSGAYKWVQRAATELGIDTGHFTGQAWAARPVEAIDLPFQREPSDANLRKASAAIATAWFMHRGYVVSIPVEPARYDLVVEADDGGLARVQVKSTTTTDRGRWLVGINRRQYGKGERRNANGARGRCVYRPDEVDYFFIVTGSSDSYLIPIAATNGAATLTLDSKYAAYKVG